MVQKYEKRREEETHNTRKWGGGTKNLLLHLQINKFTVATFNFKYFRHIDKFGPTI
jgi:hypothetical protein